MRLHLSEHQDIMNLLAQAGLADKILLTKKSGWVHIRHEERIFSFHRKKVTAIENGRFVDSYDYYLGSPRRPEKAESWMHVTRALSKWLAHFS